MALGDRPRGTTMSGMTLRQILKKVNRMIAERPAEVCWKVSRFLLYRPRLE